MTKIILITGVSGSGKTTITKYLAEKYQVFYFDDIGVPTLDEMISKYGSPEGWQEWACAQRIEKLLAQGINETVILEGSFNPEFAMPILKKYNIDNYKLICLHSDRETREKRLIKYRNQPELANQDMENFAKVLREKTLALGGIVIDSSGDLHDTVKACLLAIEGKESLRIEIPIKIAETLVKEQFPQYAHLAIRPVEFSGWDNATFHLGDEMLIRLPRGEAYALKVHKEQALLHKLKSHLSVPIPQPIAMGMPSKEYPWTWSIYKYLEGDSANSINLSDKTIETIAHELAKFLNELHKIDTKDAPKPGLHNHWRGEHVSVYEFGALSYIEQLKNIIDSDKARALWERAVATHWEKPPVWVHGDLASGNILVRLCAELGDDAVQKNIKNLDCHVEAKASPCKDGRRGARLSAVLDFGGCSIGDPACDLVMAWTFFKGKSREIFKQAVNLDEGTWLRAKAWVLWKAGYELVHIEDKSSAKALEQIRLINEVFDE